MNNNKNNLTLIEHPLLLHKLTNIRKKETSNKDFRELLNEMSRLISYEVLKNIKLKEIDITTPISKTKGYEITQKINLFPILRAGLGMVDGLLSIAPNAKVGHIGIYRDEKTLKPVNYLFKSPKDTGGDSINIILDPILATGGSAESAINILKSNGIKNIKFIILIASKEAIEKLTKLYNDVHFFVVSIDEKLNDKKYIVPGLGDAGDRIFGTK